MHKKKSKAELRHEKIKSMLLANDLVTVSEFCKVLNCSEATIRNDLRYLEEKNLIKRSYGGAVATGSTAINSNLAMRSVAYKDEKKSIANYIVNNILKPGQTIILDSGTTYTEVAQKIIESSLELTVLTNSFASASILSKSDKIKLYLSSGCYDHTTSSFHDEASQILFKTMRADILFLAINGISSTAGFTISGHEEAPIKQAMINCSQKCIVAGDYSKIGKIGLKVICGFEDVDTIITNENGDKNEIDKIKNHGTNVVLV